jgi:FliI/YscN family ATPase
VSARIIDGRVFDAEAEARSIRAAAAAELATARAETAAMRDRAHQDVARALTHVEAARADAARIRSAAGLPAGDGQVTDVVGLLVSARCSGITLGDIVTFGRPGAALPAEVVGFRGDEALLMPLGDLSGLSPGAPVTSTGGPLRFTCGPELLGRVIDGLGRPLDGAAIDGEAWPVERAAVPALSRAAITRPLRTGVRAIDGFLTLGEGQRIGVFAAAGVGKSTLLTQLARTADADVIVLGLVGERGRELGDWMAALGHARTRTVLVCATSDAPSLVRVRAASVATATAEFFRDQGARVLLLLDSLTRVARAQREVGLSVGEPPARHGYPPSAFALLPRLIERAGTAARGSITAIYSVLVAGNDLDEPIADEVRGIVDGHIVLDRRLAARGHFPPIDVPASVSRFFDRLTGVEQRTAAARARRWLAIYEEHRDLLQVGAYKPGGDRVLDEAVARQPELDRFLTQGADESSTVDDTCARLVALAR